MGPDSNTYLRNKKGTIRSWYSSSISSSCGSSRSSICGSSRVNPALMLRQGSSVTRCGYICIVYIYIHVHIRKRFGTSFQGEASAGDRLVQIRTHTSKKKRSFHVASGLTLNPMWVYMYYVYIYICIHVYIYEKRFGTFAHGGASADDRSGQI